MAAMTPEQIAALDADAAAGTAEPGKVTDYTAIEGGLKDLAQLKAILLDAIEKLDNFYPVCNNALIINTFSAFLQKHVAALTADPSNTDVDVEMEEPDVVEVSTPKTLHAPAPTANSPFRALSDQAASPNTQSRAASAIKTLTPEARPEPETAPILPSYKVSANLQRRARHDEFCRQAIAHADPAIGYAI